MPAKLKYGEPTQMISIRVPQSRKEEIRELVRGVLNGNDKKHNLKINFRKQAVTIQELLRPVTDINQSNEVKTMFDLLHMVLVLTNDVDIIPQPPKSK